MDMDHPGVKLAPFKRVQIKKYTTYQNIRRVTRIPSRSLEDCWEISLKQRGMWISPQV